MLSSLINCSVFAPRFLSQSFPLIVAMLPIFILCIVLTAFASCSKIVQVLRFTMVIQRVIAEENSLAVVKPVRGQTVEWSSICPGTSLRRDCSNSMLVTELQRSQRTSARCMLHIQLIKKTTSCQKFSHACVCHHAMYLNPALNVPECYCLSQSKKSLCYVNLSYGMRFFQCTTFIICTPSCSSHLGCLFISLNTKGEIAF